MKTMTGIQPDFHCDYGFNIHTHGIGTSTPITLEENVWIGANSTVCGGVTIGAGSIIGAGSVVTHDISAGVIAAGVLCKVICPITEKDKFKPEDILF